MTWRLTDHREPEDGWRCPRCEALVFTPLRLCAECEPITLAYVGERHAGHARILTEAEIRAREAETGHRL